MPAAFGTWLGTPDPASRWRPQIAAGLVDDPRFPPLLGAAAAGVSFANAVVLVTGASNPGSIGYRIAGNFCRGGARVVITGSRDLAATTTTAEKLLAEHPGGSVLPTQVDQGDLAQIDALFAYLKEQNLALTHVYPFAAINHPQVLFGIKPEDHARVFAINTFGVYHIAIRHCRQSPRKDPWYVVIPLSPNDGRLQGSGLYPASKQALRPLVVQGHNEVGKRRNGTYVGIDIAWTRSALMEQLDAGVAAARDAGLKVFETADTADACTLLGTPAAHQLAGTVLDAGGGFGTAAPEAMAALVTALGH